MSSQSRLKDRQIASLYIVGEGGPQDDGPQHGPQKTRPKANDRSELTSSAIAKSINTYNNGGPRIELFDKSTRGLRIRPMKDGKAVWSIQMRDQAGQKIRFNLGEYPTIGIAAARKLADATRYQVREKGEDPNQARQEKRKAAKNPPAPPVTLGSVINDEYGKSDRAKLKDGWASYEKRMRLVFGHLYDRPAKSVTRVELQLAADKWKSGGTASAAVRYIRPVLKWAVKRDLVAVDTYLLDQPRPVRKGERYLSDDELSKLLPVLRSFKSRSKPSTHALALRFMLLTATRLDETCGARWSEIEELDEPKAQKFGFPKEAINQTVWIIPSHDEVRALAQDRNIKSKSRHVILLSTQALAILNEIRTVKSNPDHLIFSNRKGQSVDNWDRVTKQIQKESGVYNWHRHDLRRTAATIMGNAGVPPYTVEAVLNHKNTFSSLASIYNKSEYSVDVGQAVQVLGDRLDVLEKVDVT